MFHPSSMQQSSVLLFNYCRFTFANTSGLTKLHGNFSSISFTPCQERKKNKIASSASAPNVSNKAILVAIAKQGTDVDKLVDDLRKKIGLPI